MTATTTSAPFMTRRQSVAYLQGRRGIPISFSYFCKLRAQDKGPSPDAYYGKYELFTAPTLDQWADEGLRPGKTKAAA
jgi:hypothetical protein